MFASKLARQPLLILTLLSPFGGEWQEYLEERSRRPLQDSDLVIFAHIEEEIEKLHKSKEILLDRTPNLLTPIAPGNDYRPCAIPKSYSRSQFLFLGEGMPAHDWEFPSGLQRGIYERASFLRKLKASRQSDEFDRIMASEIGRRLGDPKGVFAEDERYVIIIATLYKPARILDEAKAGQAGERAPKTNIIHGYAPDDARSFLKSELATNAVGASSQTMRPAVSIIKPSTAAPAKRWGRGG